MAENTEAPKPAKRVKIAQLRLLSQQLQQLHSAEQELVQVLDSIAGNESHRYLLSSYGFEWDQVDKMTKTQMSAAYKEAGERIEDDIEARTIQATAMSKQLSVPVPEGSNTTLWRKSALRELIDENGTEMPAASKSLL